MATVTTLVLALTLAQPVVTQSFMLDFDAGYAAWKQEDYVTALKHFGPLAGQGNARARRQLGWMYYHGDGAPQDSKQAVDWFRKTAEQGFALAQSNLGYMYPNG